MSRLTRFLGFTAIKRRAAVPEPQIDRYLELAHLKVLLDDLGVNVVLDVGANEGQFALDLRGIGYSGRIVSFEPVPATFEILRSALGTDTAWSGHQLALGSQDATVTIHVPEASVMSSILDSVDGGLHGTAVDVPMRRLDALLDEIAPAATKPRVFLKMDTQGFDLEVFRGAEGRMADVVGLQSELSVVPLYKGMPHYLEALTVYEQAGYDLYNVSVVNRMPDGQILEMNCFMRRP